MTNDPHKVFEENRGYLLQLLKQNEYVRFTIRRNIFDFHKVIEFSQFEWPQLKRTWIICGDVVVYEHVELVPS